MKHSIYLLMIILILNSCCKNDPLVTTSPNTAGNNHSPISTPPPPPPPPPYEGEGHPPISGNGRAILVDASRDYGLWWSPQFPNTFNPQENHQGKKLADYLKKIGFQVDELPYGAIITKDLLDKYSYVIRPSAFFLNYSDAEIKAYEEFINRPSSLFLLSDHMLNPNTVNDRLATYLGLNFEGALWGPIFNLQAHPITDGIFSVAYYAGSYIQNADPEKITVLGSLPPPISGGMPVTVMGIRKHPTCKIFFIGDTNVIEQIPQPFTDNWIRWLFQ